MLVVLMTMMYLGVILRTPTRDGKNVIVAWKTVRFGMLRPQAVVQFLCSDGICYTTRLNRRCQYWSTQGPHEHDYFERYGWVDNFCRKVDHDAPWCYTTDPDKRWEECDCHQEDGKIQ